MPVYSKLLLSAGGGIISSRQQAEQVKKTATVLVGLGGTGIDCLRTIKTQVYSRLKPDDPKAVVPRYEHIRFLGIDTAEMVIGDSKANDKKDRKRALEDTEFFSIANSNLKQALSRKEAIKLKRELDWLRHEDIKAPDMGKAGAGGIRQVGRFMMMDKSSDFMSRIESEINSAKRGLQDANTNVHIFAGLSGGTGSGSFLDVCYMIKHVASKIPGVTVFGYFFLPDVNLSKIPQADGLTRGYIPKNGYAALQELDYCMQLQYNGGGFVQEYQGHTKVEWKSAPVDMCHLICATNANGDVIPNAYDYAMNVTAEYIMDFLTKSDDDFDISQQLSNFRTKVGESNTQKQIGSELAYCVLGASCASLPLREINTYLASQVFSKFAKIKENTPIQKDVEDLAVATMAKAARGVGDIYEELYSQLRQDAEASYIQYLESWKYVWDYGNADMINHYTNQTAQKQGNIEKNMKALLDPKNENSLMYQLRYNLTEIIKDINRGANFAYNMLSAAATHNLVNIIDGLIEQNNSRFTQELAQTDLRVRDAELAKSNFENKIKHGLFESDAKRFEAYKFYVEAYEIHKLELFAYEKYGKLLRDFREQLVDITATHYIKLKRVMENLIDTFKENDAVLAVPTAIDNNSFEIPLMTIEELKKSLDAEISKLNIDKQLSVFMETFIRREDKWLNEDENEISRIVTDFFVEEVFSEFAGRTITAFLKAKYEVDSDDKLTDIIYREWMLTLTAKARPLFSFNGSIWTEANTGRLAFLSVPQTSKPISDAAQRMKDVDQLWKEKKSELTDRIYVMSASCALPLSSYSRCSEYENAYFAASNVGIHYYEGKPVEDMRFNDWRKLPSLTPASLLSMDTIPPVLKDNVNRGLSLYKKASELRLIDDENRLLKIDEAYEAKIDELLTQSEVYTGSIKQEQVEEVSVLVEKLKALESPELSASGFAMQNDGFKGRVDVKLGVQKDYFISSPAYHDMVEETVNKLEELNKKREAAIAKLEAAVRSVQEGAQKASAEKSALIGYCDALFTGVILLDGRQVIYREISSLGIPKDKVLSKLGEEFEFGSIPVYQAFLSYQTLEDSVKADMKKKANDKLNSPDADMNNAVANLKEAFKPERVTNMALRADDFSNKDEIISFLEQLIGRFRIFESDIS